MVRVAVVVVRTPLTGADSVRMTVSPSSAKSSARMVIGTGSVVWLVAASKVSVPEVAR